MGFWPVRTIVRAWMDFLMSSVLFVMIEKNVRMRLAWANQVFFEHVLQSSPGDDLYFIDKTLGLLFKG